MRRTVRLVAAVASLTWFVASCGGDDDDETRSDETSDERESEDSTTTAEDTSTTQSPEDEVIAAYEAANDALYAAYNPPDPQSPGLLESYAGEALGRHQSILQQLQAQGIAYDSTIELHPTLVSLAGGTAVVEDCFRDRTQSVRTATQEPVGEATETVLHVENHLERIDGTWKIVQIQELSEPCEPG